MEIESRGFRLNYEAAGAGPAIVLIPGVMMGADRWIDTGYVDRLARRYRVLALDPLGFGRSERVADPAAYGTDELALDVLAVLEAEGVDRAVMWGYSRGAGLAADVAALHPDRVMALVAGGNPIQVPRSALRDETTLEDLAPFIAGDWGFYWDRFPVPLPDEVKRRFEATNDPVAVAAAQVAPARDLDVASLVCPTLFYVGGAEWFADVVAQGAEELGAEFVRLEGLGHAETHQATGAVCDAVEAFLSRMG